jgi:hypothetical protein
LSRGFDGGAATRRAEAEETMGVWTPGPGATEGDDAFEGDDTAETADGLGGNDDLRGNGRR